MKARNPSHHVKVVPAERVLPILKAKHVRKFHNVQCTDRQTSQHDHPITMRNMNARKDGAGTQYAGSMEELFTATITLQTPYYKHHST